MTYGGPERRHGADLAEQLERLADGQDHLRESAHALRNSDTVILLRLDRLERDVTTELEASRRARSELSESPAGRLIERRLSAVEAHVAAAEQLVAQGRGALAAMRVLAGGSVLTTAATLSKLLGWW